MGAASRSRRCQRTDERLFSPMACGGAFTLSAAVPERTTGSLSENASSIQSVIELQAHTSVFRRGSSDTRPVSRWNEAGGACSRRCYESGQRPAPNHTGWRPSGGSHGDDMGFDGASVAGPQPSERGTESSPGVSPGLSECGVEPQLPRSAELRWSDSTSFSAW